MNSRDILCLNRDRILLLCLQRGYDVMSLTSLHLPELFLPNRQWQHFFYHVDPFTLVHLDVRNVTDFHRAFRELNSTEPCPRTKVRQAATLT